MTDHLERIGQTIGDYHLIRWLGGGGFGHVYLAEHTHNGKQVALKILAIRLTKTEGWRAFLNEARTMRLRHPHIVPLLDFGLSREDAPFIVMEYAPLGTLRDRHPSGSRLPLPTVVEYTMQIASALQYAHEQRIVHRDVKPENMLVQADGMLLLSDFGIATTAHSSHSVNTNEGVGGTLPYMAPEQLKGQPRLESDQYSLAIVIYEWLSGRCPFRGTWVEIVAQHTSEPPPSLVKQVSGLPTKVEAVLFKALAKHPKDRFASIQSFVEALQQASSLPTLPDPAGELLSEEPSPKIAPLLTIPPLVADSPTILPSSVASKSLTQPVETARASRQTLPVQNSMPPNPPTTPPIQEPIAQPVSKRRLSKRQTATILLLLVLLLLAGIVGNSVYSTAVTTAHTQATATAKVAPTATVIASINSYDASVIKQGIMFGFNASHTRNNSYEQIIGVANVSGLQQKWVVPTGSSIFSSPAVANGLVYVGSFDYKLYALDATTGKQKWVSDSTGSDIISSPAVANGLVYVGSDDHKLYAFDATTGKQKWVSAPTGGGIGSSPTVVNGLVYVGSDDGKVYAFVAETGKPKWVSVFTGSNIYTSPAVANGLVYVGSNNGKVYAFDATTGKQKWVSAPTGNLLFSSPAVANGLVYIGSEDSDRLYAFDATTGKQKWVSAPTGDSIFSSPAVANGLVYIDSDRLYAFDDLTGKPKWVSDSTGGAIESSPTVANGLVYVGSFDHKLYAFDATTGKQKWVSAPTGDYIASSPAVSNGVVYVGSFDHKLYTFSLPQTTL